MAVAGALYPMCIPQRCIHLSIRRSHTDRVPANALAIDSSASVCARRKLKKAACPSAHAVSYLTRSGEADCAPCVRDTTGVLKGLVAAPAFLSLAFPDLSSAAISGGTETVHALAASVTPAGPVLELAEIDSGTAQILASILSPILGGLPILFVIRIIMSWYPQLPVRDFPYVLVYAPTEPVLGPTRKLLPPIGGVDVAPVVWLFFITFVNEILLGQQGLLILLSQKA